MTAVGRPAQNPSNLPLPPNALIRGIIVVVVTTLFGIFLFKATEPDTAPTTSATVTQNQSEAADTETTATDTQTEETSTVRPPSEVATLAANASGTTGAAGKTAEVLQTQGYNVLEPTDAATEVDATVIYYTPGFDQDALQLAAGLGLPTTSVQPMPSPAPVSSGDVASANVLIMVGPDLVAKLP